MVTVMIVILHTVVINLSGSQHILICKQATFPSCMTETLHHIYNSRAKQYYSIITGCIVCELSVCLVLALINKKQYDALKTESSEEIYSFYKFLEAALINSVSM